MMTWISNNIANIILTGALTLTVTAIIRNMVRRRQQGVSCSGCSGCPSAGACPSEKQAS